MPVRTQWDKLFKYLKCDKEEFPRRLRHSDTENDAGFKPQTNRLIFN